MIKSTILILAGAGIIGTGGHAVAPQAFQISAGNVTYSFSTEGVTTSETKTPQFGVSLITRKERKLTLRF